MEEVCALSRAARSAAEGADGASTPALRPRGRQQPTPGAPARRRADELGPRLRNSRRRCHPRPLPLSGPRAASGFAAKALAPASVGVVHTISPVKAAAVYEGISMIATRAHARLSTAKGRRMGESPRVCLSVRRPPAHAADQQQHRKRDRAGHRQSRHRGQVRDD